MEESKNNSTTSTVQLPKKQWVKPKIVMLSAEIDTKGKAFTTTEASVSSGPLGS